MSEPSCNFQLNLVDSLDKGMYMLSKSEVLQRGCPVIKRLTLKIVSQTKVKLIGRARHKKHSRKIRCGRGKVS